MSMTDVNGINTVPGVDVSGTSLGMPAGPTASFDVPSVNFGFVATPEVHVGGAVGDVLPFTGTGPGTLPLLLLGIVSLIVGAWCALFGRAAPVRKHDDRWPDISDRALAVVTPLPAAADHT